MIDADERAAMGEALRGAIAVALEAGDADVDAVLAKLGWREMLADEPGDAVAVAFDALGATCATATALDDVLAAALGHAPRADLAVVLPRFAGWDPPGRIEGGALHGEGLATARAATAGELLVVCGTGREPRSVLVPVSAAQVGAAGGIDPAARLHTVVVRGAPADARGLGPGAWRDAVALGRRAVAHQIAGATRSMLALARSHALERVQFGRPVARFQAVRHRLAEVLVAVEALEACLDAAREAPDPDTAALAKAQAGRTAHTAARHGQQVLAGIGFTTEHPFHRYLKRVLALEGLFGSADAIVLALGRRLLAERRVPTLIEL